MAASTKSASPPRRSRGPAVLFWSLILAGLAGNAWYLARDYWPLPDLKTINSLIREKKYDEADAALREHLRRSPHNGETMIARAGLLSTRGDNLAAARQLHDVPEWWPNKPDMQLVEGQIFLGENHAREAEAAWLAALRDDPLHPPSPASRTPAEATFHLMRLYALERRTADGVALTWRMHDLLSPADRESLLRARLALEFAPRDRAADAATLKAHAAADPSDWQARRALAATGALTGFKGDTSETLATLEKCVKALPDDPLVREDYLNLLHETRGPFLAEVAKVPEKLLEGSAGLQALRAEALTQQGDRPGALAAYLRAIALDPANPDTLNSLAALEDTLGKPDEAATHRDRAGRVSKARQELAVSFREYLANSSPALIHRIVAACETLGWTREAEAWSRFAPIPGSDEPADRTKFVK